MNTLLLDNIRLLVTYAGVMSMSYHAGILIVIITFSCGVSVPFCLQIVIVLFADLYRKK